jgi:hypothetical protein
MISQDQYNRFMAVWKRDHADGRPLIPYGAQVAVCDFWRAQALRRQMMDGAAAIAMAGGPTAPLTVLRGRPWEDCT